MSKNKEYVKNTLILFIGKFATQFVSFLLLPLFTHYLITEDFGWVDLLQSYISLLVPVLTLRLDSSLFRFLIDKRKDEKGRNEIITNVLIVLLTILSFSVIAFVIVSLLLKFKYIYSAIINLIVLMISNVLLQILRGLGKNKEYSISSIISGFINLITNVLLILVFDFGANSIFISSIISNLIVIIYVMISTKLVSCFDKKLINKDLTKKMLKYSLPMIPNSLSWWIVNVSDRTLISIFLGKAFNGIYTVSCKFSNLLNSIFSIFNMSWQETASLHINDDDRDEFFSNMINSLLIGFSSVALLIMAFLPLFYNLLIGNEYLSSYDYIPILLYANTWNVMISLIGGIYIALKKTKEIASTTLISAIINLVINFLLIKKIGLYAASISTLVSYFVMSMYRYYDCKKYVDLNLDFKKIILFTAIFIISMVLYLYNNIYLNILNILMTLVYIFCANKNLINKIFKNLLYKKIKRL